MLFPPPQCFTFIGWLHVDSLPHWFVSQIQSCEAASVLLWSAGPKHQRHGHRGSRGSGDHHPAGGGPSTVRGRDGVVGERRCTCGQRCKKKQKMIFIFFPGFALPGPTPLTPLPLPADLQGVSWDGPSDMVSQPVLETLPVEEGEKVQEEEPLYAVPRKDHLPKFTLENFVLHKMLGKGSFGKVSFIVKTAPTDRDQDIITTREVRDQDRTMALCIKEK